MKDNLFEILLSLFEKTLSKLKETHLELSKDETENEEDPTASFDPVELTAFVKKASHDSLRVFTPGEQLKLSKASYQFLMKLYSWNFLAHELVELVMNQLMFSESPYISLQETKWAVRNVFAPRLDENQIAFLDLLLYHQEDNLPQH